MALSQSFRAGFRKFLPLGQRANASVVGATARVAGHPIALGRRGLAVADNQQQSISGFAVSRLNANMASQAPVLGGRVPRLLFVASRSKGVLDEGVRTFRDYAGDRDNDDDWNDDDYHDHDNGRGTRRRGRRGARKSRQPFTISIKEKMVVQETFRKHGKDLSKATITLLFDEKEEFFSSVLDEQGDNLNLLDYGTLIGIAVRIGMYNQVPMLVRECEDAGYTPSARMYRALITQLGKTDLREALNVFDRVHMNHDSPPDEITRLYEAMWWALKSSHRRGLVMKLLLNLFKDDYVCSQGNQRELGIVVSKMVCGVVFSLPSSCSRPCPCPCPCPCPSSLW